MAKKGKRQLETERSRALKRNVGLAIGGVALAALVVVGVSMLTAQRASAAPVWSATTLEGETIGSDVFKGDVYVVDFFFLTCGICEKQLPSNKGLVDALASRTDFHFVSVTADPADTPSLIREHQQEKNATWAHVRDTFGLYRKFEVRGNPNLVFVDRDGNVALVVDELASTRYLLAQAQRLLDGDAPTAPEPGDTQAPSHGPGHTGAAAVAERPAFARPPLAAPHRR